MGAHRSDSVYTLSGRNLASNLLYVARGKRGSLVDCLINHGAGTYTRNEQSRSLRAIFTDLRVLRRSGLSSCFRAFRLGCADALVLAPRAGRDNGWNVVRETDRS